MPGRESFVRSKPPHRATQPGWWITSTVTDLSVIVVSYNTRDLLRRCLQSLAEAANEGLSLHTIVVDNASPDGSAAMVAAEFPSVELVRNERNLGFAAATNIGLKRANARYLLLLNPDTEVKAGALPALVSFMDAHPRAAVAGPSLVYGDGTPQHSCFRFPTLAMQFLDLFPLHHRLLNSRLNGRYPLDQKTPFEVDHPLGACMIIRPRVLEQVGLLDEGFFIYCEEVDWCWRAKKAGWRVYCVPEAVIVHHSGQSTRQFADKMYVELYRSRYRLFAKHYGPVRQVAVRLIIRLGLAKRAFADRRAARAGQIDSEQLRRRLEAYSAIARM
jgi:N-acetylglucosaminyl-diphospho-decaprenol L-rhamnosyltransferase